MEQWIKENFGNIMIVIGSIIIAGCMIVGFRYTDGGSKQSAPVQTRVVGDGV